MSGYGPTSEALVAQYLVEHGYAILAQNVVFGRIGELDIVAEKDEIIVFVEVRSRTDERLGSPFETVGPAKQKKLRRLGEIYLERNAPEKAARFDVASVLLPSGKASPVIEYIEDAFW